MRPCTCELFRGDPHFVTHAMVYDVDFLITGPQSPEADQAKLDSIHMATSMIDDAIIEAHEAGWIGSEHADGYNDQHSKVTHSPWTPAHAIGIAGKFCHVAWVCDGSLDWTSIEIHERLRQLATKGEANCVSHFHTQVAEQVAATEAG